MRFLRPNSFRTRQKQASFAVIFLNLCCRVFRQRFTSLGLRSLLLLLSSPSPLLNMPFRTPIPFQNSGERRLGESRSLIKGCDTSGETCKVSPYEQVTSRQTNQAKNFHQAYILGEDQILISDERNAVTPISRSKTLIDMCNFKRLEIARSVLI